jgi:hypothetical protein
MFPQPDLLPYLRHRLALLDLRPMFQEECHLYLSPSSASLPRIPTLKHKKPHLPYILECGGETREHLGRDIGSRQPATYMLKRPKLERREVELVCEAVHRFCADGSRTRRVFGTADTVLGHPLSDPFAAGFRLWWGEGGDTAWSGVGWWDRGVLE